VTRPGRRVAAGITFVILAAVTAVGAVAAAPADVHTVHVRLEHSRFVIDGDLDVRPGETIRYVVENADPIDHEFIIGDQAVQDAHELGTEAYHPPRPGEMSVPPGAVMETTYTYPTQPGSLILGCHLPGHYAYGMRDDITIR
jgi:uncharacterized cupredoxin-like copper-binding protein